MRIAIIGGGIAGMAAAFELEKARTAGSAIEYTLYEATPRLGGVLSSVIIDGAVLELGPDSFLTEKPAAAELCRELGLGDALIGSNDKARKTYIIVRNRLVPLPDGLMFLVPTKLLPTALTPLFSPFTKARMALELLHPPSPPNGDDESVASLVERHFGAEVVDRLADPLLSGIYGGDAAQLSARTVLPRLVEMESEYGSLTRGMLAAQRKMRTRAKSASNGSGPPPAAPRPIFTTLNGGMQQLVDTLAARMDAASVRLSTQVSAIEKHSTGWAVQVRGNVERFDAVIVATPARAAAVLLSPVDAKLSAELAAIPYSSSITVNLIYDEASLGPLPVGFGFLVPASEGRALLACTFVHRKFLGRTPPGKAVLRAFLGGVKNEALLAETDETLVKTARRELGEILSGAGFSRGIEPEYAQVARWPRAMAQYAVGHRQRMQRIADRVADLKALRLAGNAYDGIGISDCIRLGRQAARELVGPSSQVREATS
jgi:protoporphyrinogen/coproporphyrinogen III oxidase